MSKKKDNGRRPDKIKASLKYKISDPVEMENFMNMKRSATRERDRSKFKRKPKHPKRDWD